MKKFTIFLLFNALSLTACSKSTEVNPDTTVSFTSTGELINTELRIQSPEQKILAQSIHNAQASSQARIPEGMNLDIWATELFVADPVALEIDDQGRAFFTRTHRQKNSEFDIRGHRDWEEKSVLLQSVEEKQAFLKEIFASENSENNAWLRDLNNDGLHDWQDLRIEKEQVYRVEDSDGDGWADKNLLVVEDFHDETTDVAGALLVTDDAMFVGVGPDMWRLKDNDNNGVMDQKQSIAHGFGIHVGFSGHGMSGSELGPDGRVYWGIGDIGFRGKGNDKNGKIWSYPNRGVIARANPDGSDFEIFAMGVRNTHEFVFDEFGNLISVDNDGDHPGESERIVYLTEGSDTGWRINWQLGKYRDPINNSYKVWMDEGMYLPWFEEQPAHITPTIANYKNGPTGMVYNPGTALSSKWQNTFFVVEFIGDPSRSGVHAFKLDPKGAGFELKSSEHFIKGLLATGMDFGPDGALYIADWIDGWKTKDSGRIWKLDDTSGREWKARQDTAALFKLDFPSLTSARLAELLAHDDQRIRQKSQQTLVKHKSDAADIFQKTLSDSKNQLARIHAIWGLSQLARKNSSVAQSLLPFINDNDSEIRAQIARWLGDIRFKEAAPQIVPLLEDEYARTRFFAAEALGRMAYKEAVPAVIKMLEKNNGEDRYLRHAGSLALARMNDVNALKELAKHENPNLKIAAIVALRRMQNPAVVAFLDDESETVVAEAVRAIHDDASIESALPELGKLLLTYTGSKEAIIRRAISANLRVATQNSLELLLQYIQNENAPLEMREEALAALSTWTQPSVFDRVDGQFRGHIQRDNQLVEQVASKSLLTLLSNNSQEIRKGSVLALGRLNLTNSSEKIYEVLLTDKSADVRSTALNSLAQLKYAGLNQALTAGMEDQSSSVRSVALDLLVDTDQDPDFIAQHLAKVLETGRIKEKKAALLALAKLPISATKDTLSLQLNSLSERKYPEALVLDLVTAIENTKNPGLNKQVEIALDAFALTPLERKFPGVLAGGDASAGRRIFLWHQSAQCIKCHTLKEDQVKAGPNLRTIGSTLSKEEILQALVEPSARIAPGFGSGTSSMPNMSYFLNKNEIRDLVSYLSSLN